MKTLLISILLSTSSVFAQSGKELYNTYCSACHSTDGKGANNGIFPPLANSEWVQGEADRMIQVILHGLEGGIQVSGKDYNLVMPPQGEALTDEQIASITTYVRSSWGNKETSVTADQIKKQRELSAKQKGMWPPRKILRMYPIKTKPKGIRELLSYAHKGSFDSLAELRASEADSVEEEHAGYINTAQGGRSQQNFGIVWEGWLEAPEDGSFTFTFNTDHGGALTIDGKEVISRDGFQPSGKHPVSKALVELKQGRFDIKVEYYHKKSHPRLDLVWQGPGVPKTNLSYKKQTAPSKNIILKPEKDSTIIHRNFISDTGPRGIAVGYSQEINLIFNADTMSIDHLWSGEFLDVGKMWTNRSKGTAKPLGKEINRLGKGLPIQGLASPESPWSKEAGTPMRFNGYKLNSKQQPTFYYKSEHFNFEDKLTPSSDGKQLMRTISITPNSKAAPDQAQYFRVFNQAPLSKQTEHLIKLTNSLSVDIKPQSTVLSRESDVIIPLMVKHAGKQVIEINYTLK